MPIRVEHQPSFGVVGATAGGIGAGQRAEAYAQFSSKQDLAYARMAAQQSSQEESFRHQKEMRGAKEGAGERAYDAGQARRVQQYNAKVARIREKQSEGKYTPAQADEYIGRLKDQLVGVQEGQMEVPQRPQRTAKQAADQNVYEDRGKVVTVDPQTGKTSTLLKSSDQREAPSVYDRIMNKIPYTDKEVQNFTEQYEKLMRGVSFDPKTGNRSAKEDKGTPFDAGTEWGQKKIVDYIEGQRKIQEALLPQIQQDEIKKSREQEAATRKARAAIQAKVEATPEYKAEQAKRKMHFAAKMMEQADNPAKRKGWEAEYLKQRKLLVGADGRGGYREEMHEASKEMVDLDTGKKILSDREEKMEATINRHLEQAEKTFGKDSPQAEELRKARERLYVTNNERNRDQSFARMQEGHAYVVEGFRTDEQEMEEAEESRQLSGIKSQLDAMRGPEAEDEDSHQKALYNAGLTEYYEPHDEKRARLETRRDEILKKQQERKESWELRYKNDKELFNYFQQQMVVGSEFMAEQAEQVGATRKAMEEEQKRVRAAEDKEAKKLGKTLDAWKEADDEIEDLEEHEKEVQKRLRARINNLEDKEEKEEDRLRTEIESIKQRQEEIKKPLPNIGQVLDLPKKPQESLQESLLAGAIEKKLKKGQKPPPTEKSGKAWLGKMPPRLSAEESLAQQKQEKRLEAAKASLAKKLEAAKASLAKHLKTGSYSTEIEGARASLARHLETPSKDLMAAKAKRRELYRGQAERDQKRKLFRKEAEERAAERRGVGGPRLPLSEAEAGSFRAQGPGDPLEDYTPKPDTLTTRGVRPDPKTVEELKKKEPQIFRDLNPKQQAGAFKRFKQIARDTGQGTKARGKAMRDFVRGLEKTREENKQRTTTTPSKADRLLKREDKLETSIAGRREEAFEEFRREHGGVADQLMKEFSKNWTLKHGTPTLSAKGRKEFFRELGRWISAGEGDFQMRDIPKTAKQLEKFIKRKGEGFKRSFGKHLSRYFGFGK